MLRIIQFILLVMIIYIAVEWNSMDFSNPLVIFRRSKLARNITNGLNNLYDKKILKKNKQSITAIKVLIISFILFVFSTILIFIYIKVLSTAIILSIPFLFMPLILSRVLIEINKKRISKQLLFYAINIKNQMKDENNIILAIKKAMVEEPLAQYIEDFKQNVFNGMNVIYAFEKLKADVDVKDFTELINSFEVCYKNGGDFVSILEKYILMKTKEKLQKEENEEKIFSSVVTLIVMMLLNVFVIITFIFGNDGYANIIRTTFIGKIILNINSISYILMVLMVAKVYKEE